MKPDKILIVCNYEGAPGVAGTYTNCSECRQRIFASELSLKAILEMYLECQVYDFKCMKCSETEIKAEFANKNVPIPFPVPLKLKVTYDPFTKRSVKNDTEH